MRFWLLTTGSSPPTPPPLSVEDTAAALGCSEGTVKSQTARGLTALRDLLPADYLVTYGAMR